MTIESKKMIDEHLTQKDIVQLLLHNAQHMVTREELRSDIKELKEDIQQDISRVELRISKVETSLKQDIAKVDAKFDKIQWLIIGTIMTVLLKDYILSLF